MRLLIVGFSQSGHLGCYLASAARQLGLDYTIMDANRAEASSPVAQSFSWRLRGRRPGRLRSFASQVVDFCRSASPDLVVTTGRAPLERPHVEAVRALGVKVVNYSSDDPWNPKLRAGWFLAVLPSYDAVFTTRRANLKDFRDCGVTAVHYLPFGYDPEIHRPWAQPTPGGRESDVLFVGGSDADRLPLISSLVDAGLQLALFGGYWNWHLKTRGHWRGMADQDTIRAASAAARICLCLVRRANRDGHVMRSFEAAAIGGCILAEDTLDHRELFADAACYFSTSEELVEQAKKLVNDGPKRNRLTAQLRKRFVRGRETYADRLSTIVRLSALGDRRNATIS